MVEIKSRSFARKLQNTQKKMNFVNKNIVMILSLVLAYAIIYFTADDLPRVIESLSDVRVERDFFSKYKFPIAILAFLLFLIISWLKKKLKLYRGDNSC
jgi:amino acid permease